VSGYCRKFFDVAFVESHCLAVDVEDLVEVTEAVSEVGAAIEGATVAETVGAMEVVVAVLEAVVVTAGVTVVHLEVVTEGKSKFLSR
jgi:hypothetical protein